jgi:hypothetical protein
MEQGMIILHPHDVGFLHVLDYYLFRASHELALHRTFPLYWHFCASRYRDIDGDTYS